MIKKTLPRHASPIENTHKIPELEAINNCLDRLIS